MSATSQIQLDLSKKLQRKLGELLERETAIAKHVLPTDEVMLTMMEACACMLASTAATVAATHDDPDYGSSFDRTVQAIAALVMSDRERAMTRIAEQRARAA